MTAIGIGLEWHSGHPRGLWMGVAPSHLGLLSPLCRSRRLCGGATLTSERQGPLSQGRTVLYATRPKPPAQLIPATRSRLDPEDLREVIVAYQIYVAETVTRFGGFVAKYMGDGVLVYFGYPRAYEHDAER